MISQTSKNILIGVGACTLGILVGIGAMMYVAQQKISTEVLEKEEPIVQSPPVTPAQPETPVVRAGVEWLPLPEKVSQDLGLLDIRTREDGEDVGYVGISYYKTGVQDGKNIIIAEIEEAGMGDNYSNYVFFEQRVGSYTLIAKASTPEYFDVNGAYNGPKKTGLVVAVDTEKGYEDLRVPDEFLWSGVKFTRGGSGVGHIPTPEFYTKNMTKVSDLGFGTLYSQVEELSELPGAAAQTYYVRKKNGMSDRYESVPDIAGDDMVLKATWSNGKKNTESYQPISTGGCGIGGGTPIVSDNSLEFIQTGTTSLGSVYEFKDSNTPLLKKIYEVVIGSSEKTIPYKTWLTKHPVVIFKDTLGRALLYNNTTYGPQVECGKPVVYLYPTTPTQVSVKVAADMTISEPAYNSGWTVNARPDGLLQTPDGKEYGSLYWEGLGHGVYPKIKKGLVVARNDVEKTLRVHLSALGLNAKESSEFLDFWLSKMPSTPFVRLSWLGTREMDALAPMSVAPKPESVIRVFLDFEGLDRAISLEPQVLTRIPRNGFTVVEWGGLLRK